MRVHWAPQKAPEPTGIQVSRLDLQEQQHLLEGLGFQTCVVLLPAPGVAQSQARGRNRVCVH